MLNKLSSGYYWSPEEHLKMKSSSFIILHLAVYLATLHRETLALCNIPAASRCAGIFNSAFIHTNYHQLCPSYKQAASCVMSNVDSSSTYDHFSGTYTYCYTNALRDSQVSLFVANAQQIDPCCSNYFYSYLWSYFGRRTYTCPVTSATTVPTTSATTQSVCPSGCCVTAAAYCCSLYNVTYQSSTNYRYTCSLYKATVKCLEDNLRPSSTYWCNGLYNTAVQYFMSQIVPIVDNCCGTPMAPHYSTLYVWGFPTYFKCPHGPLPTSSSGKPLLNYGLFAGIGICVLVIVAAMIAVTCVVVRKRRSSRSQARSRGAHATSQETHHNAAFDNHNLPAISTVDVSAPPVIEPLASLQEEEEVEYYNDMSGATDNPPTLPPRRPMSPPAPTRPPKQKKARGLFRLKKEGKDETPKLSCSFESKPTPSRGKLGKLPPKPPHVILKQQLKESEKQSESGVARLYPDIPYEQPEPKTPTAPELQDEDPEESYDHIW